MLREDLCITDGLHAHHHVHAARKIVPIHFVGGDVVGANGSVESAAPACAAAKIKRHANSTERNGLNDTPLLFLFGQAANLGERHLPFYDHTERNPVASAKLSHSQESIVFACC